MAGAQLPCDELGPVVAMSMRMREKTEMKRSISTCLCVWALVGCGSTPTAEAPAASTAPVVPPTTATVAAPPSSVVAPLPSSAATLAGHFWRAQTYYPVPQGTDLSSSPDGVSLDIDEARFGTDEELAAPPSVSVFAEAAVDAPSPGAALLAYAQTIHVTAGERCHLGVARELLPIAADDAPRAYRWTVVQLCPLPEVDGAITQVGAWEAGEDLSVGETGGVFLSIVSARPLMPIFLDGDSIALDAPGVDYVLLQSRLDDDAPDTLQFAAGLDAPGVAAITAFAGHPLEISTP